MKNIKAFFEENDGVGLLKTLCAIPSPSHFEDERASFCLDWFRSCGYENAYIDSAKNVLCPINCEGSDSITVFSAHTDTVFPDREPMPFTETEEKYLCPAVGDDTASLTLLLLAAKYLRENGFEPKNGVLLVCNSCEEGLGNLLGTRTYMRDYAGRIKELIAFDSYFSEIANACVGSERFRVSVKTRGGHSFADFGATSAIHVLSRMINKIYAISVPHIGKSRTTYNVGLIEGGTSVNTIAQSAEMLCEFRSDNADCMEIMRRQFFEIFDEAQSPDAEITVETVGERPCGKNVDEARMNELCETCRTIIEDVTGQKVSCVSSSTDCNIPLSMGIPAIAIGIYDGDGEHTREEWIYKDSLLPGFEIALRVIRAVCG